MALAEETGIVGFPQFADFLDRIIARFSTPERPSRPDSERMDFVSGRLWDNSDAFATDYDVQSMMSHFPHDF